LQESSVQALLSSQTIAVPWQVPALQMSPKVQAMPSLHALVLLT
jgi:hypothetical protein